MVLWYFSGWSQKTLKKCGISLQEVDNDIIHLKQQFNDFFKTCQINLSQVEYLKLSTENLLKIKCCPLERLNMKIKDNQIVEPRISCKPEKSIKNNITSQKKNLIRNRKRRLKNKFTRNVNLASKVELVKSSGLVINLTDIEVPYGTYLYLSKGNSFIPSRSASKHDNVSDTNEFRRKLAWRTYFYTKE